jgi:hypothetical protein
MVDKMFKDSLIPEGFKAPPTTRLTHRRSDATNNEREDVIDCSVLWTLFWVSVGHEGF